MNALSLAGEEMASITAELRVKRALMSNLPPVSKHLIRPGDEVKVYRENSKR